MIAIVDYGMGNLRSVEKALARIGFSAVVTSNPDDVEAARGVILPGVGAFGHAMRNLNRLGLSNAIRRCVRRGTPFLGICLGMQLLFLRGEEGGETGLGLLEGDVPRLAAGLKIPHMGWNQVRMLREVPLFQGIPDGGFFYFVHSYAVKPADESVVAGVTEYGSSLVSVVAVDNLYGVQFHPEKSGDLGLRLLRNFGQLVSGRGA